MEHIKIINIPLENEEEDQTEEIEEEVEEVDDYQPPKKHFVLLILLVIFALAGAFIYTALRIYSDYEIKNEFDRVDSAETTYVDFKNNILKYSSDGVFYTTYSGNMIWNYTYDMTSPEYDMCGDYIVVYDKKGTELDVFSSTGAIRTISTNTPIVEARIAAQGTVAVLMNENNTSYLRMYDKKGNLLVGGEMHPENSGYPISIALSSDATKLLISLLNLNDGSIKTNLQFYDYSSDGKEQVDNLVATYSYIDTVFPQVDFVDGDRAIAFGDKEIVVFNNNTDCTVEKEIFVTDEMKSIFYNEKYFGYICEVVDESGAIGNELSVYNMYGFKYCSKVVSDSYARIQLLANNEVALYDGNKVNIYNKYGVHKFEYDFPSTVYEIIPGGSSRRYVVLEEKQTKEIRIK